MDMDEVLKSYKEAVAIPDPALDQAFAGIRDAFIQMGITEIDPIQARLAISVMGVMESLDASGKLLLAAYLGQLLD